MYPHLLKDTVYKPYTKAPLAPKLEEGWEMITGKQGAWVKIKASSLKREKNMDTGLAHSNFCHQVPENQNSYFPPQKVVKA